MLTDRLQQTIRQQRGFTLIEVMVVVVILGVLLSLVVPRIMDNPGKARVIKAKADIRQISTTLNRYRLDNYRYPSTEQGLQALITKPSGEPEPKNWQQGGYMDKLPQDPWGNPYQYLQPGQKGEYDIFSYGRDGTIGGEGEDADISNNDLD